MTFQTRISADSSSGTSPSDYNLDRLYTLGYRTYASKPIVDLATVKDHIDSGWSMASAADGVISYTFASANHITSQFNNKHYGLPDSGYGYSRFTPLQEAAGRASIQLWDDLIAPRFVEQNGMGNADIIMANSLDPAQAYAFYPSVSKPGQTYAGRLFTNDPNVENWTNNWFGNLGYGKTTLIHELGHTLGLSHPGAYNYDPNVPQTYAGLAEYAQDSNQYSIMSYWTPLETGARIVNWNTLLFSYAQTPMLHDILTIQSIYGADLTTRVGDTVYGFNSTAGRDVFDFASNPYPFIAIYDAGGIDTIDLSGFNASQFVDLRAGSFSSIGAGAPDAAIANAQLAELTRISGEDWGTYDAATQALTESYLASYMTGNATRIAQDLTLYGEGAVTGIRTSEYQNVSIAYGTTIENAIGGSARDLLIGNEVANRLEGRGGDDVLRGNAGNDTLIGGMGNDILEGGLGNDILLGDAGIDRLTGGSGADTFKFTVANIGDLITDFAGDDRIDLSALGNNLHYISGGAFTGSAGEVNFIGSTLSADLDGNGVADFSVVMQAGATLHPDQLMLHA